MMNKPPAPTKSMKTAAALTGTDQVNINDAAALLTRGFAAAQKPGDVDDLMNKPEIQGKMWKPGHAAAITLRLEMAALQSLGNLHARLAAPEAGDPSPLENALQIRTCLRALTIAQKHRKKDSETATDTLVRKLSDICAKDRQPAEVLEKFMDAMAAVDKARVNAAPKPSALKPAAR